MKIRKSVGGAFADARGRLFIRVTVAPRKRPAKLVPWARSLDEAEERAHIVQGWVNLLRRAGRNDLIADFISSGANAAASELPGLSARVDSHCRSAKTAIEDTTVGDRMERWLNGRQRLAGAKQAKEEDLAVHRFLGPMFNLPVRTFSQMDAATAFHAIESSDLSEATKKRYRYAVGRALRETGLHGSVMGLTRSSLIRFVATKLGGANAALNALAESFDLTKDEV